MENNGITDQAGSRSPEGHNHHDKRFRRFILDPKSSMKTYIAEGLLENQHQYDNSQSNQLQYPYSQTNNTTYLISNPTYSQQPRPEDHLHYHDGEDAASMQSSHIAYPQSQTTTLGQDGFHQHIPYRPGNVQSSSFPEATTLPDVHQAQQQNPIHEAAQHLEQLATCIPQLYPPPVPPTQQDQQLHYPQQGNPTSSPRPSPMLPQEQDGAFHTRYGPAPPPPENLNASILAPRTYHRMVLHFETLKAVFFTATAHTHDVDLGPLAAKLKSFAHEIWTLRFTRAQEFDYSDSAHEQTITIWKAAFEFWTDVLEDLTDPARSRYTAAADLQNEISQFVSLETPAAAPVKQAVVKAAATAPAEPVVKKVAKKATAAADGAAADGEAVAKPLVKKKVAAKPKPTA